VRQTYTTMTAWISAPHLVQDVETLHGQPSFLTKKIGGAGLIQEILREMDPQWLDNLLKERAVA
jgi:hypothetical protein